jgi:hypothetical protein
MKVFVDIDRAYDEHILKMHFYRIVILLAVVAPIFCWAAEPVTETFSHTVYLQPYSKLRQAAEQGDPQAQYDLAYLYYKSGSDPEISGISRSEKLAAQWYREAALQGHSSAQYNMAVLHLHGHGVERDALDAYAWLLQAAANGHKDAKVLMAELESVLNTRQLEEAKSRSEALPITKPRPEFAQDN